MPRPMSLAFLLCSCCFALSATAGRPDLLATSQDTTSLLLKQAAALLAAGHPAQAATVYLRAGDAAMSTHQLNLAEQAYQQAANAFHRANQPDDEATADEKLAAAFEQEAAMVMPAKGGVTAATPGTTLNPATAATPAATTPTHPAAPVPVARPAPPAAHPVPSAARLPAGLYTCSEFNGFLLDYGDLRIRDDGRYQGIRNGANGPVNPYIYYPATHAITWKGDLGGNFGTILQSVYRTDNATKPYIEITFQTKYQHTMSCGLEGP